MLAIAEMANPDWVSVPLVGWSHVAALRRVADVHLVTHARNSENLAKAGLREGDDFTALENPAVEGPVRRLARLLGWRDGKGWSTYTALSILSYYAFERELWRRFGTGLRAGAFDVVHRITPVSPSTPSPLAVRCARAGVPFVLGPINGGVPWPRGYDDVRLREREFLSYLRGAHRLLPYHRSTWLRASAIVVGSRHMADQIPPALRHKMVYMPENGLDPARFGAVPAPPPAPPLRVAFVGRLVAVKCVDLLLEAAAPLLREGRMVLDVVGEGPELPAIQALAARERLGAAVRFAGWVDHRRLKDLLGQAHAFAFPSIRDFGGGVVLEAMAMGLAPVVVDYGGPGDLVTPATGIAVPIGPRREIAAGFRAALERLAADPAATAALGERARARVARLFTWEAKASQTLEVYRWVMGQRDRPDFGTPFADPA